MSRTPFALITFVAAGIALAACGSTSPATSAAESPASAASVAAPAASDDASAMAMRHHEAFCANAKAIGSLRKGQADAMAMSPAESAKDFQALAAKVTALTPDADPALAADIAAVAERLGQEAMMEQHKAAGAAVEEDMKMLDAHAKDAQAAASRLVAAVSASCSLDIS